MEYNMTCSDVWPRRTQTTTEKPTIPYETQIENALEASKYEPEPIKKHTYEYYDKKIPRKLSKEDLEDFVNNTPNNVKVSTMDIKEDVVNNPKHYNHKGVECIVAMEAMLSPEEFIGYLRGNIFKYQWRYPYKNGNEDLAKANWYKELLDKRLGVK